MQEVNLMLRGKKTPPRWLKTELQNSNKDTDRKAQGIITNATGNGLPYQLLPNKPLPSF